MDAFNIIGDDIFFRHWRVGRKPDDMPATAWDEVADLLESVRRDQDFGAEIDAAVTEREHELNAEHVQALEAAEERGRELGYDRGYRDAEAERDADTRVAALKARLRKARE